MSSGEKTERPSPKRLRDAREKGQVAKSHEIGSASVVLAVFCFVWFGYDFMLEHIEELLLKPISLIAVPFDAALPSMLQASMEKLIVVSIPVVALAALAAIMGSFIQVGALFSVETIKPNLDKLNPKNWFKKTFSVKNLVEFIKSLLKVVLLMVIFRSVFMTALPSLMLIPYWGLSAIDQLLGYILKAMALYVMAAFVVVAALDFIYQRYQFNKEQMMTKEEVKNEYKEMEGDPHIKGQRRHLHQEMAMNDQMARVRKSSVLITNPTHLAIALYYEKGKTELPVVNAKGEGAIAMRMIKAAEEAGVPIMRNVPLAHDLWEQGKEEQYIPSELIEPVAEVMRWLRDIKEKNSF